jgi:hypothetical protein
MPTLRSLFRGPRTESAPSSDYGWVTDTAPLAGAEPVDAAEALLEMSSALLAALEARNDETEMAGHAQRVAELAERMAIQQGVPVVQRATLRRAALLHEVGMIGVPAELLHRDEPLTVEEMARVRAHAEVGAAIARATCGELGAALIRHQHDDEPTLRRALGEGTDAYRLALILRAAGVADSVSRAPGLRFVHEAAAPAAATPAESAEAEALAA